MIVSSLAFTCSFFLIFPAVSYLLSWLAARVGFADRGKTASREKRKRFMHLASASSSFASFIACLPLWYLSAVPWSRKHGINRLHRGWSVNLPTPHHQQLRRRSRFGRQHAYSQILESNVVITWRTLATTISSSSHSWRWSIQRIQISADLMHSLISHGVDLSRKCNRIDMLITSVSRFCVRHPSKY